MARTFILVVCISIVSVSAYEYRPSDPVCLDQDEAKLRFINESCQKDSDCYDSGSAVVCKNGQCVCDTGYDEKRKETTQGDVRGFCFRASSSTDSSCNTRCEKPYTCAEPQPHSTTTASEASTTASPTGKTCQCLPPYTFKDGSCYLECKPGEFYSEGECVKRCGANEYASGSECRKMSKIGGPCQRQDDCSVPYSECQRGKCSCNTGFSPNKKNDACVATSRTCPVGEPIKANGAVVECKVVAKSIGSVKRKPGDPKLYPMLEAGEADFSYSYGGLGVIIHNKDVADTCDEGQFCMVTNFIGYMPGAVGHCCQRPQPACPVGKPHHNATCLPHGREKPSGRTLIDSGPDDVYITIDFAGEVIPCPVETHSCRKYSYGGGFEFDLCCPNPCPTKRVHIDGHCYPRRQIDDQCDFDKQCDYSGGACKHGKCACRKNGTIAGTGPNRYCDTTCKDGLVRNADGDCVSTLSLGEKCGGYPDVCGIKAKCSSKTSTCICECGHSKLDSTNCGPEPKCAAINRNGTGSGSKGGKRSLDQYTFCIIPGKSPLLSSAVKKCPKGQYCAKYMDNMGICCELPDTPLCHDGKPPEKRCDPQKQNCSSERECVNYLNEIEPEDPKNFQCCPSIPYVIID